MQNVAMHSTMPSYEDPLDFSLVQGGPLFQMLLRAGLVRPSMDLAARRIIVISMTAWLPLFALTLLSGNAVGGVTVPFILDVGLHARFLLSLPLLVAAEVVVHERIKGVIRQFLDRGIVAPEDEPQFKAVIHSAMRLRNSVLAEVLLLIIAVLAGNWLGGRFVQLKVSTWYGSPIDGSFHLNSAGNWYSFVSLTIFRFLWFRWYFRLFIWYRFLWKVSRHVPLHLNALHPDRAGGLGFLGGSVFAFAPVLLAHTVAIAGMFGGRIWHDGATLPQFKMEIVAWFAFLMVLILAPLFFFVVHLGNARRAGLREYGIVASRYVAEFRRKWIEGHAAEGESLVGSGDIQSLADLSNSYEIVREMNLVPFGKTAVIRLAILMALPFLPLTLTMIPLEKLIDRALGVLL